MNLSLVFRISAVIFLINAVGIIFMPSTFFGMAGFTMSASLVTLGQFLGITIIFLAILAWRTPEIAGDAITSYGQLWAIGNVLWFLIVGYHIVTGQAGGMTAYGNAILFVIFAILFFRYSKKN
tara:strand:- start:638 stop:1006 length:369 start_codon:yes stop_codon:yes gene_type:complete